MHNLTGVVPFVDRLIDVDPFITLQADQIGVQQAGDDLGDFGLSDARFSF